MSDKMFRCSSCSNEYIVKPGELILCPNGCQCQQLDTSLFNKRSAFDLQEGGSHYKRLPIQPTEYNHKNGLRWCEGNVVKYTTRHRSKGGVEDVKKAVHYLQFLLEMDYGIKMEVTYNE